MDLFTAATCCLDCLNMSQWTLKGLSAFWTWKSFPAPCVPSETQAQVQIMPHDFWHLAPVLIESISDSCPHWTYVRVLSSLSIFLTLVQQINKIFQRGTSHEVFSEKGQMIPANMMHLLKQGAGVYISESESLSQSWSRKHYPAHFIALSSRCPPSATSGSGS